LVFKNIKTLLINYCAQLEVYH